MVQNMYMFSAVIILLYSFKINYLHGATLNETGFNNVQGHFQRSIRQVNAAECDPPTIMNGNIHILKRKSTTKNNFLSLNITCDYNFILQPPNDYLMSCFNGFWDVDEVPQCKKCVQRSENIGIIDESNTTDISVSNTDSELTCPDSLYRIYTDCGNRIDKTHQPFVVKGTLSKFAEFPWHVAIYKMDSFDSNPVYHCGGSIITGKSILTVAHCLSDAYGKIRTSREYYAAAGKYHRNYNSDRETTQQRKIVKIDLHPRYKGELTNYAWDIAVVVVEESFEISTLVHPVCIDWMTRFENEHLVPDQYGEVAGWGKTETNLNTAALELRVLKVPYINVEQCNRYVPKTFIKYITHDKFCAGYMNGSSVCDGDSGGGLVFEKQEMGQTKYYIRGLVSVGLQHEGSCDNFKYSTYTKVSEYISFIRDSIQNKKNTTTSLATNNNKLPEIKNNSTEEIVYCKTPNEEQAKCISIYDCKIFITALQNNPTPEMVKFMSKSQCGKFDERKICCGSTVNYLSVINSNPVTTGPIVHRNINLLPTPGVCGRQTQVRQGRIVGGYVAKLLDFPWIALLEFGTPKESAGFLCAGFLINERYVMTAAHCASRTREGDAGKIFNIRLGEYDTDTEIDCVKISAGTGLLPNGRNCTDPPLNVNIEEIILHPLYNSRKKNNDIALLRLAKKISYTDFIKPICLPINGEKSLPGRKISITGWGRTDFIGEVSSIKLKASLSVKSNEECYNAINKRIELDHSHICVGSDNGAGDCFGDGGGPVMSTFTNSSDIYAEGILSFGVLCGSQPTVATNIPTYMNWILDVIKS